MLAAALFYAILGFTLLVLPAALLAAMLLFFELQRRLWRVLEPRVAPRLGPLGRRIASWPSVQRLAARRPRALVFIARRFEPRRGWGLPATLGGIAVVVGGWLFVRVLTQVNGKDPLVTADVRLHNTVPLLRSAGATRFFLALTQAGNPTVLAIAAVGLALLAASRRHWRLAIAFLLAEALSGLLAVVFKYSVGHPRPTDALVPAHAASFPSGHMLSSAVVYGLLASALLASPRPVWLRAGGAALLLLLVGGIGVSRLYLGVHWPSDLLGSLALAIACLAVVLVFLHFQEPLRVDALPLAVRPRLVHAAGIGVLLLAVAVGVVLVRSTRFATVHGVQTPRAIPTAALAGRLPPGLPVFSEDLVGDRMEPVSLLFVGSREELLAAFAAAGWSPADRPTPVRVLREGLAALSQQPDLTGPATPAYMADLPQTITFERPDAATQGIRRRHHTRVWLTRYCVDPGCRPLWLATASFDDGVEILPRSHLPTHRIDPEIDRERALIVNELASAGAHPLGELVVVAPFSGTNAAGDVFRTDGRAVPLVMPVQAGRTAADAAPSAGAR